MMKSVSVILLITLTLLVGCTTPTDPARDIPTATNTQAEMPTESAEDVQIVLIQSGGIAGVDESWTIFANGRITGSNGKETQISETALSKAIHELEQLDFFEMKSSYVPLDTCCDRFTYQLEVIVNGQSQHVTALEGATETPDEFWQALDIVNAMLADVK